VFNFAACLSINQSPGPYLPAGSPVLDPQGSTTRPGTTSTVVYGGPFGTHYIACTSIAISAIERVRLGCVTMDKMAIVAKQHGRQFFRKVGSVRFVHVVHAGLCCRTPCITYIPRFVSHSLYHIHFTLCVSLRDWNCIKFFVTEAPVVRIWRDQDSNHRSGQG